MANKEEANEATQRLVMKTVQDSYGAVVDRVVGLQERNVRFAQSLVEGSIRGMHRQSERNWGMTEELVERAEEQSDAFRTLVQESVDVYVDLLCTPFSYYGKGWKVTR